jgi:hypothetical protein
VTRGACGAPVAQRHGDEFDRDGVCMKLVVLLVTLLGFVPGVAQAAPDLANVALPGGSTLPYFTSALPRPSVKAILISVHGYPRDALQTWEATLEAANNAGRAADTLLIAPVFPVSQNEAARCHSPGVPMAVAGNAVWRCSTWLDGGRAQNVSVTSFRAMDTLVTTLLTAYPAARVVTIAGFSAGAQFVQHYVGFASPMARPVAVRYVIADPGEFLYFGRFRPVPSAGACPGYDDWKLGLSKRPQDLMGTAEEVRSAYAAADVHYLEGALDTGTNPDAFPRELDKNCGAQMQGQYRLDRGRNYAAYDAHFLSHGRHTLTIVPGCAHRVACVFPSQAARAALFDEVR